MALLEPSSWLWASTRAPSTSSGERRIAFVDFWPGFDDNTDKWLTRQWFADNLVNVRLVGAREDPEVIVFSLFGREHVQHRHRGASKLVFFTGENVRPPVRKVPLCLSFDVIPHLPPGVHTRLPLWVLNAQVHDVLRLHEERLRGVVDRKVCARGFCSWVASNASMYNAEFRLSFVQSLNAYKSVACGGEVLNNVGGPVRDKIAFLRGYRFNVAFENASHPGYCTEKLLHAFAAGCVPIYWGDPLSSSGSDADFNPAALICAHDFATTELLIQHIARVDADQDLMESYLRQPILSPTWYRRLRDWPSFCQHFTDLLFS